MCGGELPVYYEKNITVTTVLYIYRIPRWPQSRVTPVLLELVVSDFVDGLEIFNK
jgi:hypothetical protein